MDRHQGKKKTERARSQKRASYLVGFFFACLLGFSFHAASAATLSFGFSKNPATHLESFTVQILVNAQGNAINAAQATVTFPQAFLEVTSVSKSGIFDHWTIEPSIDNPQGKVTFAGGLPTPGYAGGSGTIITLTVTPTAVGSGQFCFSNPQVLLNDGNGTNDLQGSPCATLTVVPGKTPLAPTISSTTHPIQSRWYQQPTGLTEWTVQPGVDGFGSLFDQNPATVPDDTSEGMTNQLGFSAAQEGLWYVHVKAHNVYGWGESGHFSIHIDMTSPQVALSLVGSNPTTDQTPNISFQATDALSGIATLEVWLDGLVIATVDPNASTYQLPQLSVGTHTVSVRAIDAAGNATQQSLSLTITQATLIQKVIDNITKSITTITKQLIPDPVKQIVTDLQQNPQVVEPTKNIVQPVARAAAAVGVLSLFASLPITIFNGILNLMYLLFSPLLLKRKRKPWGLVVDSMTGQPIKGAIVRIFETEFNKLKESQITDELGRFGFLVEPGTYTIMAEKNGFTFPSKLYKQITGVSQVYVGDPITVTDKIHHNINVTIPLDSDLSHAAPTRVAWKRFVERCIIFLEHLNWPLLLFGSLLSIWACLIIPSPMNISVLGLYAFFIVFKIIVDKKRFRSFGQVLDAATRAPIDLAAVRIFNTTTSTLVGTRITNQSGKFSVLLIPGTFYMVVTKPPYLPKRTEPIVLSKAQALSIDILLVKPEAKLLASIVPPQVPSDSVTPTPPIIPQQSAPDVSKPEQAPLSQVPVPPDEHPEQSVPRDEQRPKA